MKVIAFCDIHGHVHNLMKLVPIMERADVALFLGDGEAALETLPHHILKKLFAVGGNVDLFTRLPNEMVLEIGGVKFFATHGHMYGVKSGFDRIFHVAKENDARVVLWGHRHESYRETRDGIQMIGVPPLGETRTREGSSYVEIILDSQKALVTSIAFRRLPR